LRGRRVRIGASVWRLRPLETWDADAALKLFRERLLARLIERHAISEDLARRLLAWRHPGFSAHVGKAIPFEDKKAIEDVAQDPVRPVVVVPVLEARVVAVLVAALESLPELVVVVALIHVHPGVAVVRVLVGVRSTTP